METKAKYIAPEAEVMELAYNSSLLAGSDETINVITDEEPIPITPDLPIY